MQLVFGLSIAKPINEWLQNSITGGLKWVIDILKATMKLLNTNMKEVDKWYGIFLALATSLVVVVVIARIIMTMVSEAEEMTDATWATIIIDAVKSAVAIPIMVFLQGVVLRGFTIPLVNYAFDDAKGLSMKSVDHASKIATSGGTGYGYIVPILILLFFLVVMVVFFFKIGIFFADLIVFNIATPLVAMSIATESFDYFSTWWKKLIYLHISIILRTIFLALMVASLTLLDKGWGYLAFTVGTGYLVINTPTLTQDFMQSTGIGRNTGRMGMNMLRNMTRK